MSDLFDAFELSPVPVPGPDAVPPAPFHGIYGMPAFATIPTTDLAASIDLWTHGLGFFELFGVPGRFVHLRRWAFQDVLLVPATALSQQASAMRLSFACVLQQLDGIVDAVRAIDPDAAGDPVDTPWGTRDVEVVTPERVRVVLTAAMPFDPHSEAARTLASMGIAPSGSHDGQDGVRA